MNEPPRDRRVRIAVQVGDSDAHERPVMSCVPELRAPVQERSRDPSEPDDVAQNVLLSIHRVRISHRPQKHLSPLLRALAGIPDTDPNG